MLCYLIRKAILKIQHFMSPSFPNRQPKPNKNILRKIFSDSPMNQGKNWGYVGEQMNLPDQQPLPTYIGS
jgi:hypothetical protein